MMRLLVSLVLVTACAASVQSNLRQMTMANGMANGFVKALEFKHRLRVCNAYPYSSAADVFRSKDKLTDQPMHYKSCKDFLAPLKAGDKLEFKIGDASAGTFSVSDLPNNDAVLLLIIHRHDAVSTAVSFESHVFANLMNAQVAVIDTYKGTKRASPRIQDRADATKHSRSEELRYSSIVAVNPGIYEVELDGDDGQVAAKSELVALNRESYIVLRVGVESKAGPSFPQELVIYPNSDPAALHSGAAMKSFAALLAAALMMAW
jgi:hypothetical protein